jgi:ABC-2 type transport system permease protein
MSGSASKSFINKEEPLNLRLAPRPKYLSLAAAAVQRAVTYRMATVNNLVAGLVWVGVLYYLWQTVFATTPRLGEFDWDRMRTYVLVSYAINSLLLFYTESRITNAIRTGDVAMELIRPIDFLTAQLAQALGAAVVEGLLSSVFALLIGVFLLDIAPPVSFAAACFFLISVGLGFLVKFLISYLTALLCFWTTNGIGLLWARSAVTNLFSGAIIPLALFPDWLKTVALALPFQAIVTTPLAIYLGDVRGLALAEALGVQLVWIAALWLLARWLWGPCVRSLRIQGG